MKRGVMSCNRMILDELKSTLPDKISKKKRLARKKQLYPNLNMEQLDRATLDMGKYIEKASEKKKKDGYKTPETDSDTELSSKKPPPNPLFKMDLSQFAKAVANQAMQNNKSEQILE